MSGHLHTGRTHGGVTVFKDPIVEEVRAIRQRHAARFNYSIEAIVADMQKRQQAMNRPLVSLKPKRAHRKAS